MLSKSAARLTAGASSEPVMMLVPLAVPPISSGPAWNGPVALQLPFNASLSAIIVPAPLAWAVAPINDALVTAMPSRSRAAFRLSIGLAPSKRSASPTPETKSLPCPSSTNCQGLPPETWFALTSAISRPLAPSRIAAKLERIRFPLKLRSPSRPRVPLPCKLMPAPVASIWRSSNRPSFSRVP